MVLTNKFGGLVQFGESGPEVGPARPLGKSIGLLLLPPPPEKQVGLLFYYCFYSHSYFLGGPSSRPRVQARPPNRSQPPHWPSLAGDHLQEAPLGNLLFLFLLSPLQAAVPGLRVN